MAATAGAGALDVAALGALEIPHATAHAITAALVSAIKPVRFAIDYSCPRPQGCGGGLGGILAAEPDFDPGHQG